MNPYVLAEWTTKQNIAELVEAGIEKSRRVQRPLLVSLTDRVEWQDATTFFAAALARGEEAFLWVHPQQRFALAGAGIAHRIETAGEARFRDSAAAWQGLIDDAIVDGLDTLAGSGPTLLGGFAFDPVPPRTKIWEGFADGSLALPRYQLTTYGDTALLTENRIVDSRGLRETPALPETHFPNGQRGASVRRGETKGPLRMEPLIPVDRYTDIVARTRESIQSGAYDKIVLARGVEVTAETRFDVPSILERLQRDYPRAYTFAITRRGKTFLGATPERLAGVSGGIARATALAGTARRGDDPEEDQRLGAELLASPKNRHEHDIVVQMLRNALSESCLDVHAADRPQLLRLANVQHLYTPVSGRLRPHATLMDLIARLHPTPAVGGLPSEKAVAYIREHEGLDRGWYAGPIGWMDARKEGDFAVALRSGLIDGEKAILYAGGGIVSNSDPAAELTETELKLEPMLRAMGNGSEGS